MPISEMFSTLIDNVCNSTLQGFVGVGFIFVYFVVILGFAIHRIKKGEHMDHD